MSGKGFYSYRGDIHKLNPVPKANGNSPYHDIAMASVEMAVRDWIDLMLHSETYRPDWMYKREYPKKEDAVADIERFFLGEEFKMYTNLNGKKLLDDLYMLYDSGELKPITKEIRRVG